MTRTDFSIAEVSFAGEPGIRHVRQQVFIDEQHVPVELEWDGLDDTAVHVVARSHQGEVIGTARMLANGHIGRMAVLPAWRRRGVGSALLQALLDIAGRRNLSAVFLHAQTRAMAFTATMAFSRKAKNSWMPVFPTAECNVYLSGPRDKKEHCNDHYLRDAGRVSTRRKR
jgi:predicted GNAT family N-acyltransferase